MKKVSIMCNSLPAILLAACLLNCSVAQAEPVDYIHEVIEPSDAACSKSVLQMINKPEISAAFTARPVDIKAVCRCAKQTMLGDTRLREQFSADRSVVNERMRSGNLRVYTTLRVMTSAFSCLSEDLEKSLAAVELR